MANDRVNLRFVSRVLLTPPCNADSRPTPKLLTQEIAADLPTAMGLFRAIANEFKKRLPDVLAPPFALRSWQIILLLYLL